MSGRGSRPGEEPSLPSRFITQEESEARSSQAGSMNQNHSKRRIRGPLLIAIAVAVFGVLAMLIVDHGPWSRPHLQAAEMANYSTTGAAAQSAGATVTLTSPKSSLEPIAPGPKPAQPAIPAPGAGTP
jgi:hypothetical protein